MASKNEVHVGNPASREKYPTAQKFMDYDTARSLASSSSVKITLDFPLVEIHRQLPVQITSSVEGASVFVNDQPVGVAPVRQTLTFTRTETSPDWSTVTIRVEKPPRYKTTVKTVRADESPASLPFTLDEIRRDIPVEITANEAGASILLNTKPIGVTPLRTNLVFSRTDATMEWPSQEIRVEKEGFELRPPGEPIQPAYTRVIKADAQPGLKISTEHFFTVRFVAVPLRTFEVLEKRVLTLKTNVLSEVNPPVEKYPPTIIVRVDDPTKPFVLSRISVTPDNPDMIVYTVPIREKRTGTNVNEAVIGSNLYRSDGRGLTPVTK